jgi:hypothetical protein
LSLRGGAEHDRRECPVGFERGERLDGLPEALLVGDERPPLGAGIRHAGGLEGHQRAGDGREFERAVGCRRQCDQFRSLLVLGEQRASRARAASSNSRPWSAAWSRTDLAFQVSAGISTPEVRSIQADLGRAPGIAASPSSAVPAHIRFAWPRPLPESPAAGRAQRR